MAEPQAESPQTPDDTIVQTIASYKQEAERYRQSRMDQNRVNRDAYMGVQDWSHKVEGQSREFLPETSQTVEQFGAFVNRGLTAFGDWFSIDVAPDSFLTAESIRKLLRCFLDYLPDGRTTTNFATRLSDGAKVALLESLMVFKVHGFEVPKTRYRVEPGEPLQSTERGSWRLQIDLVRPEDWKPDPSGRDLYSIHTVERDFHEVLAAAEQGMYDMSIVDQLESDFARKEEELREKGIMLYGPRRRVVLDEFWGTILDKDGRVRERNCLCTIANDKHLIRPPEHYPFWHGEDPFVTIPMIRVPFSVWHRALYDDVVPLNLALNELFNLMVDGGIASVWGIKQLRMDMLEDPGQVTNGIRQGMTLAVSEDAPQDAKVLEQITTGQVPQDALAMYNLLERQLQSAAKTNDLKLGQLPPRQVKATEVVEASQSSAAVLDSIVKDMEVGIERVLRKAWLTTLQNVDDIAVDEMRQALTRRETIMLARMSAKERFIAFASAVSKVKVHGLSSTLAKARDFQKIMALLQLTGQNPMLFQAMLKRFSADKILTKLMKVLNIDPTELEYSQDENPGQQAQTVMALMERMNPGSNQANTQGEPGLPSEINQEAKPSQVN